MFSFHKPKIYRSNLGCCICKAKSSSSRFTDSNKYENEFERCFRIQEKRSGEICNACVLLVKRWKKLSPENRQTKHWHHVVDARAGPGTKLTGNRRLPGPSTSTSAESGRRSGGDVLPLSSSQSANSASQQPTSSTRRRVNSLSQKACAIDTNVSTFTFGEPATRRSYLSASEQQAAGYSGASGSSVYSVSCKPQSALNSSAFESVIKRFRQRQQQQQLEAQRRSLNRQLRQKREHQRQEAEPKSSQVSSAAATPDESAARVDEPAQPNKRQKRSSESIGSMVVDGCRVSSILDVTKWRKEKICCGVIFRGLNNEVVVFPRLLKPCEDRVKRNRRPTADENSAFADEDDEEMDADSERESSPQRPPRAFKSGSISSCDSSTSGTGSMEQPVEKSVAPAGRPRKGAKPSAAAAKTASAKRPVGRPSSIPTTRRQQKQKQHDKTPTNCDTDSNLSSSSSSAFSSSHKSSATANSPSTSSSSGDSAARLLLIEATGDNGIDQDRDDDDDERPLIVELADVDDSESSTDAASSSLESLGAEKSGPVGAVG